MQINRLPLDATLTSPFRRNVGRVNSTPGNISNNVSNNVPNNVSSNVSNDASVYGRRSSNNPVPVVDQSGSDSQRLLSTALVEYSSALQAEPPVSQYSRKSLAQLTVVADRLPASMRSAVNAYVETGRLGETTQLAELAGFDAYV